MSGSGRPLLAEERHRVVLRRAAEGRTRPRPWMRSASRLVAKSRSVGACATSSASTRAAAGRRCSTLSHTTCVRRSPTRAAIAFGSGAAAPRRSADRGEDELGITKWRECEEHGPTVGLLREQSHELDREARLARPAGAEDRQDSRVSVVCERDRVEELLFAAEKLRRRGRQLNAARVCAGAGTPASPAGRRERRPRSP